MKTLTEQLAQYASYHRDPRNVATHFIGIPLIVIAITALLSRPQFDLGGIVLSPALVAAAAALVFYFLLDLGFGLIMTALMLPILWFGAWSATLGTGVWLAIGLGCFIVGWAFQFIGHYWEGRKPAFVDDLVGLLIGPLFVVAEAMFLMGLRRALQAEVETRAGGMRSRRA
ncbi:Mpo1 family 2-hydroxy fatty acid dioxygenase [Noviherbaspirillum pedocola]|uniref:DUF962 domain-containing protein n=1 Tax=Noviherbaspirillum pedocola TaxID=2801341 RepID=A0A934W3H5_9BURK|nr:Mpo1-like protein [Noviherbaspirillum pedocola]MBK4737441.1 DUF962 domain-containing protein [Noviherbaspirillum pedocola]